MRLAVVLAFPGRRPEDYSGPPAGARGLVRFLHHPAALSKGRVHMSINAKDRKAADEGKLRLRLRCYGGGSERRIP